MDHNFQLLKAHILPLSESENFDIARTEWDLIGVEVSEEFGNCPCGHEIKEHCHIKNRLNGKKTYVGNICIKRFIGIDTGTLFDGLKRISEDITANANDDLIRYAEKFGFLFDKEFAFLMSIKRKRIFTEKQMAWKIKINRRIINKTVVRRRSGV